MDEFETLSLRGKLTIYVKDRSGRLIDTFEGKNVVMSRAKFILSRLLGGNEKAFTSLSATSEWPNMGPNYPESLQYPFSNNRETSPNTVIEHAAFGGVLTDQDQYLSLNLTGKQNNITGPYPADSAAFHRDVYSGGALGVGNGFSAPPSNPPMLYNLNVTGMCFGNGGHLMHSNYSPSSPATLKTYLNGYFPSYNSGHVSNPDPYTDLNSICASSYDANDVFGKPAQPPSGYTSTTDPNYPGTIYEPVENGIVPPSAAALGDNWVGQEDYNSTLYSETMRIPLDPIDGLSYPDYKSVQFKVTVPADTELNQTRDFGFARRARNYITEAGLVCGENVLVQSPDPRVNNTGTAFATVGATPDTTPSGLSNVNGAQLSYPDTGTTITSGWWNGDFYGLPKDYFTRVRDIDDVNDYLENPITNPTEYSRLLDGNNTWNLFSRRVFGLLTKSASFEFVFVWVLSF